MDWQLFVVIGIVATAVLYLGRQVWTTWQARKSGCGGGCHCSSTAPSNSGKDNAEHLIPLEQLTLRRRTPDAS
jgi:hypothetical protein